MFATPAIALAGIALSVLPHPKPEAAAQPPPGSVTISYASVNGSGCPGNTGAVALDPGATFMTVTYSQFLAQIGVGAKPRSCAWRIIGYAPASA